MVRQREAPQKPEWQQQHFYASYSLRQENILKQQGKSNIEPPDFGEQINAWFEQIFAYIAENPPAEYVKSIDVKQDASKNVQEAFYKYTQGKDIPGSVTINIYWI